ncbi:MULTISPECIES: SulP family inorganic anion transporter [unclassified Polaromonas]|jgi:SulP family sulfate permease|uniref:SulP family inorganic anion transporter n=1 Tax=unclassified Polaromonas TaxID=2638319 RepID=UPI000BCEF45D|nr:MULTISPECIES: SulP family inorganic anion transporter [unclassified Polaromonas]OYY36004.1 MAG: sodium-independent anion transporter [Polaromonas sp. 35-63-35]OYZ19691.1 MAG: sodium-independent anion transporter [Polaromonas sp. 16-63-31]OYZ80042.1 MAG: sodium-independent anion transporter [Polaromonas sp. 24-63-21]OZA52159.1 MAG: sodium-independent anion transporter [Polaromonas sp. 17-63-33]OZA87809.1 MAG: sodium-independent anion transporter [Polaromonas sp. 39-63-25]
MNLPAYLAPFRPRILSALRGYTRERFSKDLGAGMTVGIVALPLAMAFAIASGLSPQAGIWTAIIAGGLIALLGGSAVQIGGPAGAFIVIVYGIVEQYGLPNLLIATACAGVLLFLLGFLKMGTLVRYVPVSIVVGFTNGIAVLIALSQLKDLLGLQIAKMPADFFSQIKALATNIDSFNASALGLGVACFLGLVLWPKLFVPRPGAGNGLAARLIKRVQVVEGLQLVGATRVVSRVPGPVVALITLTAFAWLLGLPVETIGSRFGGIPRSLPAFALPDFSWDTVRLLLPPTLTIAVLGAVESLLCARVADQMSGLPKHDPNQELMAQGVANFVVPFFGGMPATGTIARTVTNLRAGATSPVAGLVHSLMLVGVVLIAAPLAVHVPLAVLAGLLLHVAWNMGEWREFAHLHQYSNHYRLLMLGTFFLTVVFDLTVALQVGMLLACVLFVQRMSSLFQVVETGRTDDSIHFQLYGSLFFGAVAKIDPVLSVVESAPQGLLVRLDAQSLQSLDASGLDVLGQLHKAIVLRGGRLVISGLNAQPRAVMARAGFLAKVEEL